MSFPSLTRALKELDPNLFSRLRQEITEERVLRILQPLADTLAPSQTVAFTRAPKLKALLRAEGLLESSNIRFERNLNKTGNCALLLGANEREKRIWLLAHLDIISYLVDSAQGDRYRLLPICYHMMPEGRRAPAVSMEFSLQTRQYEISAHGTLVTEGDGRVYFEPAAGAVVQPGQRICLYSQLEWNQQTGELRGSLDDAGGAVALTLAATFLADYEIELLLGLTDEEEGVDGSSNQTICRGGARLLPHFGQPELVIASDIHEAVPMLEGAGPSGLQPGDGACYVEKSSRGRDAITPPHLYQLQRQLGRELETEGIRLRESVGGYVSRTDSVNAMLRTPNVALLGFLGANRHFERDVSSANLRDLVDLARSVVCYVLLTKTAAWVTPQG